jgi:hypothetical protein
MCSRLFANFRIAGILCQGGYLCPPCFLIQHKRGQARNSERPVGRTPFSLAYSFVGITSSLRSSYERGCQEKNFSPPLGEVRVWWLTSSPTSFLEGLLVWLLWPAACSSGNANPSCLSQLDGFMKQSCSTPFGYEATQAKRWLKVPTMILCETRGL